MELAELNDLIPSLGIDPTPVQLAQLYAAFERDFVHIPLTIAGLRVKVILHHSKVRGFEGYPETFVHLITRKGTQKQRLFDRHRANKIHWIRCILEHCVEEEICTFQAIEADGAVRDYFWYEEGDFLVIMEKVPPDYLVITSFHIDDARNRAYFEKKLLAYRKSSS